MLKELESKIRRYKLDSLLMVLSEISKDMYNERIFMREVEWVRYIGGFQQKFSHYLPAWNLADLGYIAIRNSNDYRYVNPLKDNVYRLNNILLGIGGELAKKRKSEIPGEDMKLHIIFGLSQKQFWYQEMTWQRNIYYNFLRYYILLSEMPKHFSKLKCPESDLLEITGFDIKSFSQLLLGIWGYSLSHSSWSKITVTDEIEDRIPIITEDNVEKCLSFFTATYNFYRSSDFPNNPLFFKPIIKTDMNKFIVSNYFIWARKIYEGIYWIIRNKYMEQQSQNFLNNFGNYYERYVQDILEFYLKSEQYEKLKSNGTTKIADWKVCSSKYIFIIEQKSSLMTIALKDEYPSLRTLDDYLENFVEAYSQLAETAKKIEATDKKVLKLILHFENFYIGETIIKERVNKLCKESIDDLSNFFFISTEEFEKLFQVFAKDEDVFNKIIETKLDEDNIPISEGREFDSIINKYASIENIQYLDSYKHLFEDLFQVA